MLRSELKADLNYLVDQHYAPRAVAVILRELAKEIDEEGLQNE